MNRKPTEPDEMRMPSDKFDDMMRAALSLPPPPEEDQREPQSDRKKRPQKPKHA